MDLKPEAGSFSRSPRAPEPSSAAFQLASRELDGDAAAGHTPGRTGVASQAQVQALPAHSDTQNLGVFYMSAN